MNEPDLEKLAREWKVVPVKTPSHPDGWPGLAYISDGEREYGSLNEHQARAIADAHNAQLAADTARLDWLEKQWNDMDSPLHKVLPQFYDRPLREALDAARKADLEKLARETAAEHYGGLDGSYRATAQKVLAADIFAALQGAVAEKDKTIQWNEERRIELGKIIDDQRAQLAAAKEAAQKLSDCFDEDGLLPVEPIRDGHGKTTRAIGTDPQIAALTKLRNILSEP